MAEQEPSRKLLPILSVVLQLAILIIVLYFVLGEPPLSLLLLLLIFLLLFVRGKVFPSKPVDSIAQVILLPVALGVALGYGPVGIQVFASAYLLLFVCGKVFPSQFLLSSQMQDSKNLYYVLFLVLSATMWVAWIVNIWAIEGDRLLILPLQSDPALENWYWSVLIAFSLAMVPAALILIIVGLVMMNTYLADYYKGASPFLPTLAAMISVALGINKRIELVDDGKAWQLRAPGGGWTMLAGPGLLIVVDGHAVALERGGRISRVVGAGITFTEQYERPALIAPLRTETIAKPIPNVVTRDGVSIKEFNLFVYYQVDPGSGQCPWGSEFPYDPDHIVKVWKLVGKDWDNVTAAMESIADTSLRDVIARHDLNEILAPGVIEPSLTVGELDPRQGIKDEVRNQINKVSLDFLAIEVVGVDIGEVKIPKEAEERLLEKWLADWAARVAVSKKQEIIALGEADAEVLRAIENVRASAQSRMIHAIRGAFDQAGDPGQAGPALVIFLRFIEALEKMADEPSARVLFPYGLPLPEMDKLWLLLGGDQGAGGVPPLLSSSTEAGSEPESPSD